MTNVWYVWKLLTLVRSSTIAPATFSFVTLALSNGPANKSPIKSFKSKSPGNAPNPIPLYYQKTLKNGYHRVEQTFSLLIRDASHMISKVWLQ